MVVHLIECRVYGLQDNASTEEKVGVRARNYESTYHNFRKEQKLSHPTRNQKRIQEHCLQNDHNGICDWKITIIDYDETEKSLTQKELY